MKCVKFGVGLAGVLLLAGCVVPPPSGPTVTAMPPPGKGWDAFQNDDITCRGAAYQASGGGQAAQAATNNAVGSAVVGTAIGTAAGALIGSTVGAVGAGAAIGAGTGLLAGGAVGANGASYSAYGQQQRYDMTYAQCMAAKGNQIEQPPAPPMVYAPAPYAYPYPYAYPPPGFYYGPRYRWR